MHPVDVHADRMGKYTEHMGEYDFSSLSFPVALSFLCTEKQHVYQCIRCGRCVVPDFSKSLVSHRGDDAAEMFRKYIDAPEEMLPLAEAGLHSFHTSINCHMKFTACRGKVRDHCQIVGSYRGTAHSSCNLMYRISKPGWQLSVVIHNLKGYKGDSTEHGEVSLWVALSLSTLQFTPQSLDSLVKTLKDDEFQYVREAFSAEQFELIERKGVYPHDYMDSFDRFDEPQLPSQEAFFSKLSDCPCSSSVDCLWMSVNGRLPRHLLKV